MSVRLQVIIGSTRPGRRGAAVGRWFHDVAARDGRFAVELVDLAEVGLPLLDEPEPPGRGAYTREHTRRWSRTVSAGQAYVLVVPEYNHSYNAATKNALDFLKEEWRHKSVGFVGYGGTAAGARAVQALLPVVVALGMTPVSTGVLIPRINRALAADGSLSTDSRLDANALALLDDLFRSEERGSNHSVVLDASIGHRGFGAGESA